MIGAPLHLYKQLKYAYGLSRFSALWRFFALLFLILIVQTLFLQALLVLGAF
jgi:Co/Zn/Cd efflux system component